MYQALNLSIMSLNYSSRTRFAIFESICQTNQYSKKNWEIMLLLNTILLCYIICNKRQDVMYVCTKPQLGKILKLVNSKSISIW
jgi:hypothetical protein